MHDSGEKQNLVLIHYKLFTHTYISFFDYQIPQSKSDIRISIN